MQESFQQQQIDQVEDFMLNVLKNLTSQVKTLEMKLTNVQQIQEKQNLQYENLLLQHNNHKLEMKIDQQNSAIHQLESQTSISKEKEQASAECNVQKNGSIISGVWGSPRLGDKEVANLQSQINELKQQLSQNTKQYSFESNELSLHNTAQNRLIEKSLTVNEPPKLPAQVESPFSTIKQKSPILSSHETPGTQQSSLSYTYPEIKESGTLPQPQPEPNNVEIPDKMKQFIKSLATEAQSAYDYASKIHAQIALVSAQLDCSPKMNSYLTQILSNYSENDSDKLDDAFGFLKTSPYVASPTDALKRFVTTHNSPSMEIDIAFGITDLLDKELQYILAPFSVVGTSCFNYGILSNTGLFKDINSEVIYVCDIGETQNDMVCMIKSVEENKSKDSQQTLQDAIQQIANNIDVIINANNEFDLQILADKQIRHLQLTNKALINFDCIQLDTIQSLTLMKCYCPNLMFLTQLKSLMLSDVQLSDNQNDNCNINTEHLEFLTIRWSKQIAVKIISKLQNSKYQEQSKLRYLEVYESQLKEDFYVNYPQLQYLVLQYNKAHINTHINYDTVKQILFVSVSTPLYETGVRPEGIHIDADNVKQKWQKQ